MRNPMIQSGHGGRHVAVLLAGAVMVLGWTGGRADASMIGINIQGLNSGGTNGGQLALSTTAGVVSQINWNNTARNVSSGSLNGLLDDSGLTTTANLTFSSVGTWATNNGQLQVGGNQQLMQGFIYGGNTNKPTATVTNVPYATYDVYVYSIGAAAGTSAYITLGVASYYFTSPNGSSAGYCDGTTNPFTFTQATSTTSGSPTANADYVKFSNVTGSSFTVNSTYVSGGNGNVALNGVQIVSVPEPGTLALLAFGSLAVLHRRKKVTFQK